MSVVRSPNSGKSVFSLGIVNLGIINLGMVRCIGFGVGKVGKVGIGFGWSGNQGVLVGYCSSCVRYEVVCNDYNDKYKASLQVVSTRVLLRCGTLDYKNELLEIFWRH